MIPGHRMVACSPGAEKASFQSGVHTIRARLTAGLINKAERGELALQLPIGLVRNQLGQVVKEPNREIQDRLDLVFPTFLSAARLAKVLEYCNTHELCLPRRDRFGDVVWKRPTIAMVLAILKNPAYAGAFVYGRTRTITTGAQPTGKTRSTCPSINGGFELMMCIRPMCPGRRLSEIQATLQDNYADYCIDQSRGIRVRGRPYCTG